MKVGPLVKDIKFQGCKDNHFHLLMMDGDGNELCDLMFVNAQTASDFSVAFAMHAMQAFGLSIDDGATLQ